MKSLRDTMARILIALALIVQIFAPVGSSAAMLRAAFDPLAGAVVCAQDEDGSGLHDGTDPSALHHGDACGLCQITAAGGLAPPPDVAVSFGPTTTARVADWRVTVEAVVAPRLLDHIRGRAPPALS